MVAGAEQPASSPVMESPAAGKRTLVFTYGTLKRGFSNHALLQDLFLTGDATFVGTSTTASPFPLVCGPYRVPFLLNLPGSGERVKGELYSVTARGLARLDELEGVSRGHYERLPVEVVLEEGAGESVDVEGAVAYYGHRGYAAEMWARSGRRCGRGAGGDVGAERAEGPRGVLAGGGVGVRPPRGPATGADLPRPDPHLRLLPVLALDAPISEFG